MIRVKWMRGKNAARLVRLSLLGLASMATVFIISTDPADARRRRHYRHYKKVSSYNPPSASIVVDANSGKVLHGSNPDAHRHPASLTKIMTLYLLFEQLEAGKIKLGTEMDVSAHAASQAPTKLGLRPGQTLEVEDAIKGLVTKSANDAAVVVAETLGGSEERFAQMMTRKARALGMSRTTYQNASGLPDPDQITTARDQATLGRAIQERFPRYYRYFATTAFNYHGRVMRNHNKLLGRVEGVDGIKTGYTRASGFNLVSSVRRGNRHIVAVVLGGRSGGSRDATMRTLIADNIDEASSRRTVAMIGERRDVPMPEAAPRKKLAKVADDADTSTDDNEETTESDDNDKADDAKPEGGKSEGAKNEGSKTAPAKAGAVQTAALPEPRPAAAPAPEKPLGLTSGVIATAPIGTIPGSTDPIKPVKVKTLAVRTKPVKVAVASSGPLAMPVPEDKPQQTASIPAQSAAALPPPAPHHGKGEGILGTLPASTARAMASANTDKPAPVQVASAPAPTPAPMPAPTPVPAAKAAPVVHSGWIIQVGAFEDESEAKSRLDQTVAKAKSVLGKAEPFTEPVSKGDKKYYRARFAGLEKTQAENACRYLKRNDIACITIKN